MVRIVFLAEEEEEPFRGVRENVVSQFLASHTTKVIIGKEILFK